MKMAFKIFNLTAALVIVAMTTYENPFTDAAPLSIPTRTSETYSKTATVRIGREIQSPRTQLSPPTSLHPVPTLTVVAITYSDPYVPFMWAPAAKYGLTTSRYSSVKETAFPVDSASPSSYDHGQFSTRVSPSFDQGEFPTLVSPLYAHEQFPALVSLSYGHEQFSARVSLLYDHGQFPARVSPSCNLEQLSIDFSPSYDSTELFTRANPSCGPAQLSSRVLPLYDPAHFPTRLSPSHDSVKISTHVNPSYEPAQLSAQVSPSYDSVDLSARVSTSYDPMQFTPRLSFSYDSVQLPVPVSSLYDLVKPSSLANLAYDSSELLVSDSRSQTLGKQDSLQDAPLKMVSTSTPMIVVASPYIIYPESPITWQSLKLSLQLKTGSLDTSQNDPINIILPSTPEKVKVTPLTRTVASQYTFRTTVIGLSRSNQGQEQSGYRPTLRKDFDSEFIPQTSMKNKSNGIHASLIGDNYLQQSISGIKTVEDIANTESYNIVINLPSIATGIVPSRRTTNTEREEIFTPVLPSMNALGNVLNTFPVQTSTIRIVQDFEFQPKPKTAEPSLTNRLVEKGLSVIEMVVNRNRSWSTQAVPVTSEAGFARRLLLLDDMESEELSLVPRTSSLEHHSPLPMANAERSLSFVTGQTQLLALPLEVANFQYFQPQTQTGRNPTLISGGNSANLNSFKVATSTGHLHDSISATTFRLTWPTPMPPPYLTPPGTSSFHVKREDYHTTMDFTLSPNFDRLTGIELGDHLDTDFQERRRPVITFDKRGTKKGKKFSPIDIGVNYINVGDNTNVRSESLTSQPTTTYQQRPLTNQSASNALHGHSYPALNASILSLAGYFLLEIITFLKNLKLSGVTSSEEMLIFFQTNSLLKKYDFVRNPEVALNELLLSVEANSEILDNGSQVLIKMIPEDRKAILFEKFSVIVEKFDKILSLMRLHLPKQLSLQELITFLLPYLTILNNPLAAVAQSLEVQKGNLESTGGEINIESLYITFNQGLDHLLTALNSLQTQEEGSKGTISNFGEFRKAMEGGLGSLLGSEISVLSLFGNTLSYYKTVITDSLSGYLSAAWGTSEMDRSWISRFLQLIPRPHDFLSLVNFRPEFITSVRNASILNKLWDVDQVTSYLKQKLDRIRSTWTKTVFFFDPYSAIRIPNVQTFETKKALAASCLNMLVENWNYNYRDYMHLPYLLKVIKEKGHTLGCASLGFMDPVPARLHFLGNLYRTLIKAQDPQDPLQVAKRTMEALIQRERIRNQIRGSVEVWPGQDSYSYNVF